MSEGTAGVPSIVVNSVEWREDYNVHLNKVCTHLWGMIVEMADNVANENGEKVKIPVGDLTNTITQVAQAYRRDRQAEEQLG